MVRGYHEYLFIWDTPLADGDLPCEREAGNSYDPQAVAVVTWCFIFKFLLALQRLRVR